MKNNKTIFLMVCCFLSFSIMAQENKEEIQVKLNALKKEYIQTKLELSETKMNEFTMLYEKYEEEKKKLKKEARVKRKEVSSARKMSTEELDELTEEEAKELLESRLKQQEAMLSLEKNYILQFTTTLSAKGVLQYQQAEREFRKDLLEATMEERKERSKGINERMKSRMKRMKQMRKMKGMKQLKD